VVERQKRNEAADLHLAIAGIAECLPRIAVSRCPLWVISDICAAKGHVRFASNSDRESEIPQTVMSALPPKADMCGATTDVRFGPIADIRRPIRFRRRLSRLSVSAHFSSARTD